MCSKRCNNRASGEAFEATRSNVGLYRSQCADDRTPSGVYRLDRPMGRVVSVVVGLWPVSSVLPDSVKLTSIVCSTVSRPDLSNGGASGVVGDHEVSGTPDSDRLSTPRRGPHLLLLRWREVLVVLLANPGAQRFDVIFGDDAGRLKGVQHPHHLVNVKPASGHYALASTVSPSELSVHSNHTQMVLSVVSAAAMVPPLLTYVFRVTTPVEWT